MYKEDGKWKKKRCYLGPKVYSHVAGLQGFQLYGLLETRRLIAYLESITEELESRKEELTSEEKEELRGILRRIAALISEQ